MWRSIRARLILATLVPSIVFLLVGIFLAAQFTINTQRTEFLNSLEEEIIQLSAWAAVTEDGSFDPKLPGATQFERTFSGWYFQVFRVDEDALLTPVATSTSLQQSRLNISFIDETRDRWNLESVGPTGEPLLIMVQRVRAELLADGAEIPNPDQTYLLTVARDITPLLATQASIVRALMIGALVAILSIAAVALIMVSFGLAPLGKIENALARIRSGELNQLKDEDFPVEIEPLAAELDLLIDENAKVVERARTQVGNLAHALKTPLSVLVNEARNDDTPLGHSAREQVGLMRSQVDRYLARARVAASSQVIGARTPLDPVFDRLLRALQKIHMDKGVEVSKRVPGNLSLRGEQQDLEEVAGNLLENAFKWAESKVAISAQREGNDIVFVVEDDGPGLAPEERTRALERGQRFDETTPGTGLGLSIVADIVSAYGGALELDASGLGGLKVKVTLPSAI